MNSQKEVLFPELGGDLAEKLKPLASPQLNWQVIDHHRDGGQEIRSLGERGVELVGDVFETSSSELLALASALKSNSSTVREMVDQVATICLPSVKDQLTKLELLQLLETTNIFSDLVEFSRRATLHGGDLQTIEKESKWLYDPAANIAIKYIGLAGHRILGDSRTIGLTPLRATDSLRSMKIKCMGVSAASPAIDALVAAGAEHIEMWDAGDIDPSNTPRFIGAMSDLRSIGASKAETLVGVLRARNPYGQYTAHHGKVLAQKTSGELSTSYSEFFQGADVVMEVIDSVHAKSQVAEFARLNAPNTLMIFMADVGHRPIAGISYPRDGNHFNQPNLDQDTLRRMSDPTSGIHPLDLVAAMVGKDLPHDHSLQFIAMKAGLMNYWSQTPDASRESSALVTKLLLAHLSGQDVLGQNYSIQTAPTNLMNQLDIENLPQLQILIDKMLSLPKT